MKQILIVFTLAACASSPDTRPMHPAAGNPVYHGTVSIDPASQQLSAGWRIAFIADSVTADSVVFLLNRGLRVSAVRGASVADYTVKDTSGFNNIKVRLRPDVDPGDVVHLDISYAGTPRFSEDSINGIRGDWIELGLDSFWHPVFAGFNQRITGGFRLLGPTGWNTVASGEFTIAGNAVQLTNNVPLIDIAFSAAPRIQQQSGASAIVYHVDADSSVVTRVLHTSDACATFLNQRYAARERLPHAKMVLAPRNGPGYARTNYIVITDVRNLPSPSLGKFICHELAHFWSSNAISSGPENWLNEAFAEFVAARFVRAEYGEEAFQTALRQWIEAGKDQPPVWTAETTQRPGPRVAYRKAPYIMHQFEQRFGTAVMDRLLERYMTERIRTTPELLRAVEAVAGADAEVWLRHELAR